MHNCLHAVLERPAPYPALTDKVAQEYYKLCWHSALTADLMHCVVAVGIHCALLFTAGPPVLQLQCVSVCLHDLSWRAVLCCAVLCCAVLCCMQAQERGELVQMQDEASYALGGMGQSCSIDTQRDSAVTITEMLSTRKGRTALR
jgi:hypothetical protein